jgi:N-acetylmuramoyl-L-alanine amidase
MSRATQVSSQRPRARVESALARLVLIVGCSAAAGCSSSGRPREDERRAEPAAAPVAVVTSDAGGASMAGAPADAGVAGVIDAAAGGDAAGAGPKLEIVEAPMPWSEERAALTLEYRRLHSDRDAKDLEIEPRVIVLHYTGAGTARSAQNTFAPARLGGRPELARGGAVNVSAHFIVDRDGKILRLQPETRYSRHCIGLNHISIGIENVADEAKWPLTEAQIEANVALVRELARRFPITHLLGHHEAAGFAGHAHFVELVKSYTNTKPDPGARFMKRVREAVADLSLAGP